jgi:murein DD-endopeptidase MepM/ murein hydrolase activator NlpD
MLLYKLYAAKWYVIFACCFITAKHITAQPLFINPLDIELKLSGNFGEIRNNHFHSGLDIKTDSVTGKKVFAVADGYISRIKVSAVGYGNALYLKHTNGYTSVYGHLLQFADSIQQYIEQQQQLKNSFEVEVFPDSNRFVVAQGNIIALSGNSGSSGGPHLHFEIRDSTEQILNPEGVGLSIADTLKPIIEALAIYEGNQFRNLISNIVFDSALHCYVITDTVTVTTKPAFGFVAYDLCNNSINKLGVYKTLLHVDTTLVWQSAFDVFAFDQTRFVNAHIDYAEKVLTKNTIERCFKLPGDSFNCYLQYPLKLKPQKIYTGNLTITDINGNTNSLLFHFKTSLRPSKPIKPHKGWVWIKHQLPYNLKTKNALLLLPAGSLYQNIYLKYHTTKGSSEFLSAIHHFNNNTIPLHKAATLSIKAQLDSTLHSKAIIVQVDSAKTTFVGGLYKNNAVSALIRTLGSFAVAMDTVAPNVIFTNPKNVFSAADTLIFEIEDELTGIAKYQLSTKQQKLIGIYDAKTHTLILPAAVLPEGENELQLEATDFKNNTYVMQTRFVVQYQKPMHNE